jgi:hypothetical protein
MKKQLQFLKSIQTKYVQLLRISFFIAFAFIGSNVFSQYCTPTVTPSTSYGITEVTLTKVLSVSGSNEGYVDRSTVYDTLVLGNSYTLNITLTNPNAQGTFFIDWNQDMLFDSSITSTEKYVKGFSMGSPHSITVPVSNPLGDIRMRVMVKGPAGSNIENPCGSDATEVEDYTLVIISGTPTGIDASEKQTEISRVYPNPANNSIQFTTNQFNENLMVDVYNSLGMKITSVNYSEAKGEHQFDTSHLANGVYHFIFHDDVIMQSQKIIVNH